MCYRQTTSRRGSPTEPARQQRVRGPDQGFSPVEGHSDTQVSSAWRSVGQQIREEEQWRERESPEPKALLPLYRLFLLPNCYPPGWSNLHHALL